ncbi:MAG: GHKL domain-containing protein [Kiritimatiellae bacterium]|nr:GHKL domain-containing protein [Kiritimatiellia bacterium]
MKNFFKGVRKRIGKLDAEKLREQYELVADEFARSEMLLHVLKDGIVRVDAKGAVLQCNPAAKTLLGSDPEEALRSLGLPLGKTSRLDVSVSYPEPRSLEARTIPFDDETVVYLRDTTAERRRTEEELRAGATKAVCDLAAGVAHEIGNPLNAIALSLQLLKRDPTDTGVIDTCMSQVKRLDGIIRDFLDAVRPRRPNLMPGSVADPLKKCLAALKQQFEERRIKVTLDVPDVLPNVALDAAQIEQVFFNLLKNAIEAVKDGGAIDICIEADDRDVSVGFRDDGTGMDAEQLSHLFEPYRTTKAKGTGLGLMVSKRIVNEHGGSIAAESSPGGGTTFTVTLPRLERRIRALK